MGLFFYTAFSPGSNPALPGRGRSCISLAHHQNTGLCRNCRFSSTASSVSGCFHSTYSAIVITFPPPHRHPGQFAVRIAALIKLVQPFTVHAPPHARLIAEIHAEHLLPTERAFHCRPILPRLLQSDFPPPTFSLNRHNLAHLGQPVNRRSTDARLQLLDAVIGCHNQR